ncbi:hypothetical protein CYMTET_55236 [Cymbomonas tetramitiformis]|uniref:Uncharacterized protein n=1 Tax=Cymbomonas tetramitiformis TaxID=36881 RepID=A0AAE0BDP1_9CHLO|nr:hypothetical protein CYMTET_55236 [Cymbomonas tetramitiformis]
MQLIFADNKDETIGNFHRKMLKHLSGNPVIWTEKDVFMAYITRRFPKCYPMLDWKKMWTFLREERKISVTFKALGYTKLEKNRMKGLYECMMNYWRSRGALAYRWSEAWLAYHTRDEKQSMPYEAFMYREEYGAKHFRMDIVRMQLTL